MVKRIVNFRAEPNEVELIKSRARKEGKTVTQFIVSRCLNDNFRLERQVNEIHKRLIDAEI